MFILTLEQYGLQDRGIQTSFKDSCTSFLLDDWEQQGPIDLPDKNIVSYFAALISHNLISEIVVLDVIHEHVKVVLLVSKELEETHTIEVLEHRIRINTRDHQVLRLFLSNIDNVHQIDISVSPNDLTV